MSFVWRGREGGRKKERRKEKERATGRWIEGIICRSSDRISVSNRRRRMMLEILKC